MDTAALDGCDDTASEASCWSDLKATTVDLPSLDGEEADASEDAFTGAARNNYQLLRGLAQAEEAKAAFEARLELDDDDDDEDDESDSEDEFVRNIGRCARHLAVGARRR